MQKKQMKALGIYSFALIMFLIIGWLIGMTKGPHMLQTSPVQEGLFIILFLPVIYYLFKTLP